MWRVMHSVLVTALLAAPFAPVAAQESSDDDIRKLDDEVQGVKTEALDIAAELNLLEERLLYPPETRLTVSLALSPNTSVQLSSIEISIDGAPATQYSYTESEQDALQKGGVQPLYTGNVSSGEHELGVRIVGKLASGARFEDTKQHAFTKGPDATTLAISVDRAGRDTDGIRIGNR